MNKNRPQRWKREPIGQAGTRKKRKQQREGKKVNAPSALPKKVKCAQGGLEHGNNRGPNEKTSETQHHQRTKEKRGRRDKGDPRSERRHDTCTKIGEKGYESVPRERDEGVIEKKYSGVGPCQTSNERQAKKGPKNQAPARQTNSKWRKKSQTASRNACEREVDAAIKNALKRGDSLEGGTLLSSKRAKFGQAQIPDWRE